MTSLVSLMPTICFVIRHADVIILTPIMAAEANTVVQTQALEIVESDSSERSIPIIAAIAIANEI